MTLNFGIPFNIFDDSEKNNLGLKGDSQLNQGQIIKYDNAQNDTNRSTGELVDLTGASITMTTGKSNIFVMFSAQCWNSTVNFGVSIRLYIDGVSQGNTNRAAFTGGDWADKFTIIGFNYQAPVSQGEHTIKIKFQPQNGGTAYINHSTLTVMELRQN